MYFNLIFQKTQLQLIETISSKCYQLQKLVNYKYFSSKHIIAPKATH